MPTNNFSGAAPGPFSTAQQFQALSGAIQRPDIGIGDAHYIHGVGPITLGRGKKAELWLAIVAGDNRGQLLANARAAAADIAKRQRGGGEAADISRTVSTQPLGVPARPFSKGRRPE